ncbi:hypothetical protein [Williamsia sp. 1135]|uniref:hypothetical protein n=1 Tax=Williamsia sp. 1135 TaxID=1889262 RepID=UPI001180AD5A|nr:hypothetical protein [Williamsia sp. 1135]
MFTRTLTISLAADVAAMIAGIVLLLFFRDTEFFWFRGQPLGIVLLIVGAVGVVTAFRKDRKAAGSS